jgi:DNA-binding transcriptional ArsR family regulator
MIRLQLAGVANNELAIAYSPLTECLLSLRVLRQSKRHPLHQPWARTIRRLPAPFLTAIERYAFVVGGNAPFFATGISGGESFAAQLASLRSLPASTVCYQLTWGLHRGRLSASDLERASIRHHFVETASHGVKAGQKEIELAVEQPEAFVAAFSELIEMYFEDAFLLEWQRIEPLLAASAADARRRIADDGLPDALPHLSPRLRGDSTQSRILIEHVDDDDASLTPDDKLVLVPSVYAWPDLSVFLEDGPWPKRIIYPSPFLVAWSIEPPPPAELQQLLRTLGNHTRLSALRLIAEKPRSTQELAPLLGVTEPTLSRHLRMLTKVGALSSRREGKFVFYVLESKRLAQLEPAFLVTSTSDVA